ncbi:5980_t:CDS:2 [Entrophospora sp. SA101]|nr:5980_t:CDS:2 [Entrophospora sp. SA101]
MFGFLFYKPIRNFFGFLYPTYASFKAIKTNDVKTIKLWLMYWIIMALFTMWEGFFDHFIFWFPFYYEIKMLFILWLIYPHSEGAAFLYNKFVNPTLTNHEQEIDSAIGLAQKEATNKSIELSRQGLNTLQQIAYDALIKGQNLLGNQINLATSTPTTTTFGKGNEKTSSKTERNKRKIIVIE